MNTSMVNGSLRYIKCNYSLIVSLSFWINEELTILSATTDERKFKNALEKVDNDIITAIIKYVKNIDEYDSYFDKYFLILTNQNIDNMSMLILFANYGMFPSSVMLKYMCSKNMFYDLVKILLEKNTKRFTDRLIKYCCEDNDNDKIVSLLIDKKGYSLCEDNEEVFYICRYENIIILKYFIDKGYQVKVDVNELTRKFENENASSKNNYVRTEKLRILIEHGNEPTHYKYNILNFALLHSNKSLAMLLTNKMEHVPYGCIKKGFLTSIATGDFEIIEEIFNKSEFPEEDQNHIFLLSIEYGNIDFPDKLIRSTFQESDIIFASIKYSRLNFIKKYLRSNERIQDYIDHAEKYRRSEIVDYLKSEFIKII